MKSHIVAFMVLVSAFAGFASISYDNYSFSSNAERELTVTGKVSKDGALTQKGLQCSISASQGKKATVSVSWTSVDGYNASYALHATLDGQDLGLKKGTTVSRSVSSSSNLRVWIDCHRIQSSYHPSFGSITGTDDVKMSASVLAMITVKVTYDGGSSSSSTYTVCFNKNDGSGATRTQTFKRGVSQGLMWMDSGLQWTRSGYTFKGWATSSYGGAVYANGQSVRDIASAGATLNLYAVWQSAAPAVQTYTVRFNKNDGSGATRTQTIKRGVSQSLRWMDSDLMWTRSGYAFKGWATSTYGGVVYANGQSVRDIASAGATLNLYAVWQSAASPTSPSAPSAVSLPGSGGTASTTVSLSTGGSYQFKGASHPSWITGCSLLVQSGSTTITLGSGTSTLSLLSGMTVTLTFTALANTTGASRSWGYEISGPVTTTVSVTQPAQSAGMYTVRFNRNDGSGATEKRTYVAGATLSLPWINSGLSWTTPSGWSIVGWAKSASATSAAYANGAKVPALGTAGQTIDLYVVWKKPVRTYTVRFNKNVDSGATAAQYVNGAAAFTSGFYHGEFADDTGTFDLLIKEDGSAFFRAETIDGVWSADCEVDEAEDMLQLMFEGAEPIAIRLVNGSWIAEI